MNLESEANRIDGYLLAAATLKEDGTSFLCVHLGEGPPADQADAVARAFRLPPGSVTLVSQQDALTSQNLPTDLVGWMLNRFIDIEGLPPVDPRVVTGLADELADIFRRAPGWFSVSRIEQDAPYEPIGAIWAIHVFGTEIGSCAIRCTWDD